MLRHTSNKNNLSATEDEVPPTITAILGLRSFRMLLETVEMPKTR